MTLHLSGTMKLDEQERDAVRRFLVEVGNLAARKSAVLPWWAWRRRYRARRLVKTCEALHDSVRRRTHEESTYGHICTRDCMVD